MPHGVGRRTVTRHRGRDAGGGSVSRARRGSVAASPESNRISVQLRGIASTAAIAVSSWLSLPWRSPSADRGTSTSGSTPLPSMMAPRQVYQPAAGNRRTNPWPTEKLPPPSTWPPVRVPTILARPFSAANAATISPALNVCSLTSITTRPWNGFCPNRAHSARAGMPMPLRASGRRRWAEDFARRTRRRRQQEAGVATIR